MKRKKMGFTLMEMLIVVAVIAILIAIAIPTFTNQLQKAANAVDLANARNLYASLMTMFADGTIDFPNSSGTDNGVWVLVTKEGKKPLSYSIKGTMFCGTNPNVKVNGQGSASWNTENTALAEIIKSQCGELKVKSFGGKTGWDWYVVQVNYNGKTDEITASIYSGYDGKTSEISKQNGSSNMEKYFHVS